MKIFKKISKLKKARELTPRADDFYGTLAKFRMKTNLCLASLLRTFLKRR